jgi:predicted metal-dependent hydrolase
MAKAAPKAVAKATLKNAPLLTPEELASRLGELREAIAQFNDGYWFESHETLEDLWQVTPLPERTLFQGIIQAAAAFVHYARGEYEGVIKLLDASLEKLREFAPSHLGIDVGAVVEDLERCRREFEELGPEQVAEWDEVRAPRISFA